MGQILCGEVSCGTFFREDILACLKQWYVKQCCHVETAETAETIVYWTQEAKSSQPATKNRRNEDVNVHECDV
jgi:hypothetical protein